MRHGVEGYSTAANQIIICRDRLESALRGIPEVCVIGVPKLSVVAFKEAEGSACVKVGGV